MPRLAHGQVITTEAIRNARDASISRGVDDLTFAVVPPTNLEDFDYLFPALQTTPGALLKVDATTVAALTALGMSMFDSNVQPKESNSNIPAAYTYFGQFVDHDITLEVLSGNADANPGGLFAADMEPLSVDNVRSNITNGRTAVLDLDSVYGGNAPRDPQNPNKLLVGHVSSTGSTNAPLKRPDKNMGDDNDVPRLGRDAAPALDRAARLGDDRNDENTIISQLQVAFLKAHNRLVDEGYDFEHARRILRQHYQQVVINDFLPRVVDKTVVNKILEDGNRVFNGLAEPFFMPLEFTVAAYRLGHTMVREAYDFNSNFNLGAIPATLDLLFTFTALSGQLGNFDTLPENWIIQWENIIEENGTPGGMARRLDTKLSAIDGAKNRSALFALKDLDGSLLQPDHAALLAVRNLLRGYRLRIPTGQAVAKALDLPVLSAAELKAAADSLDQVAALELENGLLAKNTPLWFYVLAEAAHAGGNHLGPVGSTIVAEVLTGVARRSPDSILKVPGWRTALPSEQPDKFQLSDLLRFAGVLGDRVPLKTVVVASGDTLSAIAKKQLGDADRWPEIFAANRTIVRNPDQIFPGMRLIIPSTPEPHPQLRFVVVKPKDTLSKLAKTHLGDADRWPEIFHLNGAVISDPNLIVVGQVLLLPEK